MARRRPNAHPPQVTDLDPRIATLTGAATATPLARIQDLWSGYGQVLRYRLDGDRTVVVKQVQPPRDRGRSHARKLRSYEVEQAWYREFAPRCDDGCRIARCLHAGREGGGWLFIFEDLDAAGFPGRSRDPRGAALDACIDWLAAFHARFLDCPPTGLWSTGTYWHLATRPDELAAMPRSPLRDAAGAIDARLAAVRHRTLVHGDAKPANFCWSADGQRVAAVDFQYVGGGCGMKDLAYLLSGEERGTVQHGLDRYFSALRAALPGDRGAAVEAEWRPLYPWAVADFHRFLAGWSPGWRVPGHEQALTRQVLAAL